MNTNSSKLQKISFLENIKSKYILQEIFSKLQEHKMLKIIKINKKIQNKLNLGLKYYIDYSKIILTVEIQRAIFNDEDIKLINILEKDKPYFHVYFNNDEKNEIKRDYLTKDDENINEIKIIIDNKMIFLKHYLETVKTLQK